MQADKCRYYTDNSQKAEDKEALLLEIALEPLAIIGACTSWAAVSQEVLEFG